MPKDIQKQLEEIKAYVDQTYPTQVDFTAAGFPDIDTPSISDSIGAIAIILGEYPAEIANADRISFSYLRKKASELKANIDPLPTSPATFIPAVLSIIESLKITTERLGCHNTFREDVNNVMTSKLAMSISSMSDAASLYKDVVESYDNATEKSDQMDILLQETVDLKEDIAKISEELHSERASSRELLKKVKVYTATIKSLTDKFSTLKTELEDNRKVQKEIFEDFDLQRDRVKDLLGDANRTGMAASFIARKKELLWTTGIWTVAFLLSIGGLLCVAYTFIVPALISGQWEQILLRMPITAPIIWFGWFSAKQYGYNARILEDYAYKAASAMAFEGFKREAQDANEEIRNKLLDNAIDHFGKNPLRIYEKENHASPASEMIQQCLKNDKVIDLARQAFAKIRG